MADAKQDTTTRHASQVGALGVFAVALLALLVVSATRHGPWLDEFWTHFLSDPSVGLREAFLDRWAQDVHPPLFSFVAWLTARIARLPIEQARLLNLAPLSILVVYLTLIGRAVPRERAFLVVMAISVGSSAFSIHYFAEFRSYFTGLCAFAALTATLVAQDRLRPGEHGRMLLGCGYAVSLAVSLNIHYLTTVMTIVLVAVFGIAAFIKGDRRRFTIYLVTGVIATAPFAAFVGYQWTTIERISEDYWLKTEIRAAAHMLMGAIAIPYSHAQGAVAIAWLAAAWLFLRQKSRPRLDATIAVLMVAIIAEILMLLVYTKLTAAMTERYLSPLAILSAALFSIILSRQIHETRWLIALFMVTNFGGAVLTALPLLQDPRWDEAASYLAEKQKACPAARIIPMKQAPYDPTPNTIENYNEAYAYMAQKWGLILGPVDTASTRPGDALCPDYYWIDHFFAAGKSVDRMMEQFIARWPTLKGCKIAATAFVSKSAVFEVSGDEPACKR